MKKKIGGKRMAKILIIEDDKTIQNSMEYYLTSENFMVDTATKIQEAKEKLKNNSYDILLLDVTLPDGNGFDFYQTIKEQTSTPVIFLTALDEEKDIVKGFELGADDYITKPFHTRELLSRIKNVLRHTASGKEKEEKHKIGNVSINLNTSKIYKEGKEIEVTALEYKIISFLFENKGKIISRGQILANIWDSNENYVNDNTLTVYMKRIREKIEEDSNQPKIIKTIRGLGYKIGE